MNVPRTPGKHPALVLNHGHIDPAIYTNGRGLMREQDYLARRGYVVLHTDYRGHAQSSDDPREGVDMRLGYTEDAINAVLALRTSPSVDPNRIGMLGRVDGRRGHLQRDGRAARADQGRGRLRAGQCRCRGQLQPLDGTTVRSARPSCARTANRRGSAFWRNVSAINFFDRVTEPMLIHHGESDSTCPIVWSREALAALKVAGKTASMYTYPGEEHAFGPARPTSMARTVAFLKQHGL